MRDIRRYQVYRVREPHRSGPGARVHCLLRTLVADQRLRPMLPVPVSRVVQAARRER